RYHNLVCALKVGTPALAVSYAAKSDRLMADMGLGEHCHPARDIDAGRLLEQFRALERDRAEVRRTLAEGNPVLAGRVRRQFEALNALLPASDAAPDHVRQETP